MAALPAPRHPRSSCDVPRVHPEHGDPEYRRTATPCSPSWPHSTPSTPRPSRAAADTYVERHRGRGKLLARERIELLLDPDTPFLELSPLAGLGQRVHRRRPPSSPASASIEGVECLITANDPTVRGGASNPGR
ncbi:hypothetical protein GCM10023238_40550 [Streptomyces heliomycini]